MSMKESITHGLRVAVISAIAVVMLVGMTACGGKTDEEIIREGVSAEFESLKTLDEATLDELLGGFAESADLTEFGIDNAEFFRTWLTGFDYSVDDVTVDGKNATATVTVTVKSMGEAFTTWYDDMEALAETEEYLTMSTAELYAAAGESLMKALENAPLTDETIDLPYVLNGNTWEPGSGYDTALGKAFTGGLV